MARLIFRLYMIGSRDLRCASLNVNGLSNPVKRKKVLAKMKRHICLKKNMKS